MPDLVERLRDIQKEYGWNDSQLARELGITSQALYFIFSGQRRPGVKTLHCIYLRFPELEQDILDYIFEHGAE